MQIIAIPIERTILVFGDDLGIPCRTVRRTDYRLLPPSHSRAGGSAERRTASYRGCFGHHHN